MHDGDLEEAIHYIQAAGGLEQTLNLAKDYILKASDAIERTQGEISIIHALQDCLSFCVSRDM